MELKKLLAECESDWTSIGEHAHPEVRELVLSHHRNYDIDCPLVTGQEREFWAAIVMHVVEESPEYQPTEAELVIIRAVNDRVRCWLREVGR